MLPILQIAEEAVWHSYRLRINPGPLSPPLIDHSDGDYVGISLTYPFHLSVPGIREFRFDVLFLLTEGKVWVYSFFIQNLLCDFFPHLEVSKCGTM